MLPIHRSKISIFNYDEIPPGYYYQAMIKGHAIQKFWHLEKFKNVAERISSDSYVLDFGCGPGSFLSVLGKEKPTVRAIGADIASKQIEFAQQNIASEFSDGRIKFQQVGGTRLPFEDSTFDVVTSIEVLEHIHPYYALKFLEEAKRVLKPDGKIIVTTPNYRSTWPLVEILLEKLSPVKYHAQHINKFTPNSFVKFLESAGLEVEKLNSTFILAPFLAAISNRLAYSVHKIEKQLEFHFGDLLIAEAKKSHF